MSDIQTKIFNIIAVTVAIVVFCFASSWILFDFKGSATSLKDTWSIVASLFGGITTLIAAYFASLLFNDWKAQHNKQVTNTFGLQVYELFFSFENTLSVYHQYLDELQALVNSYEYEVNTTTLHVNNQLAYITNITGTMSKLIITFYSLHSKFQAYSIVNGTYSQDKIRYDEYLDSFKDISMFDDEVLLIQENLNTWHDMYESTLALTNKIRQFEIEKLLISLKAD